MGTKTVVVSLGRDYNPDRTAAGPNTKLRCDKTLEESKRLRDLGKAVVLAMAPGREASRIEGLTMGAMMGQYFLDGHEDIPPDIPLMVNRDDREVWSTLAEMRWVFDAFPSDSDVKFVFVTDRRHGIRVMLIARWFFVGRKVRVVVSDDPASSLFHEVLGYAKLLAVKVGFERQAEWLSRQIT